MNCYDQDAADQERQKLLREALAVIPTLTAEQLLTALQAALEVE